MIVDASVATKWFLPDEPFDAESAIVRDEALDDRLRLSAPSILWPEVAHAIVGAVRSGRFAPTDATEIAARFPRLRQIVELVDIDPEEAVYRSLKIGVGAYDAHYLILTGKLEQTLVTADRRLLERGVAGGYDVAWIGDLTLRDGVVADTPQGYQ